ncbi:MAG: integration host factor subunit alpha [Candidatus Schekmanbacteria bacterium RBG_16_38_11]|uniref:Integration host factor subunit alpha n=2 Tax=Candidatus Schekmaniibacteriota TaxID=1817811 RepID=A0A1F7RC68_9BACT|nr:MAG: integration host factor subunit alpha [Candidatus Schekmanbacteria bacterium GWA2_38_11]OGL44851.1 MAG: integration host factor subunit alpha [Candidatus Schekmanbacteria bacterium RBG_16_38_11]
MTREDLKDKVREDLGLTKQEASEIVEGVIETIRQTLSNGEEIILSGFGKFAVREKKQRAGRNPKTGQEYEISPRRVVSFKPSKVFKDALNVK